MTTVPFAGCVTEATDFGPPSTSVSLASTSTALAPESSATVAASATATGGSSMHVTVTDTVATEPPFSVYVNVSGVVPGGLLQEFAFGAYVRPVPPPVIATTPLAGCVTEASDFGPPSMSVSLVSTAIALAPESS